MYSFKSYIKIFSLCEGLCETLVTQRHILIVKMEKLLCDKEGVSLEWALLKHKGLCLFVAETVSTLLTSLQPP